MKLATYYFDMALLRLLEDDGWTPMKLATWKFGAFLAWGREPLLIRKDGQATRIRDARFLERTRQAVQSLGADILCLQEIGGLASLAFLCPEAQLFCEARLDPSLPPRHRRHGVGFAFAQHLNIVPLPEIELRSAEGTDDYARNALAFEVEGRFIVGVHLKSGCQDKLRLDKRAPCKILDQQVDMMCDWMAAQTFALSLDGGF